MILDKDVSSDWMKKEEAEYNFNDFFYAKIHKTFFPEEWTKLKVEVAGKIGELSGEQDISGILDDLLKEDEETDFTYNFKY